METATLWRIGFWPLGLALAVYGGHHVTNHVWRTLHGKVDKWGADVQTEWQPRWIGYLERAILAVLVAVHASNLVTAAIAWTALKLAVGWQRGPSAAEASEWARMRARALAGVMSSVISLVCGAIGGFVCTGPTYMAIVLGFCGK